MNFCPSCGAPIKLKNIDGVHRYACNEGICSYVQWNNPVPVVAALVNYNDLYIIARNALWPDNIYSLISGYLDEKEAPEIAVMREVKEELNLDASTARFLGHYNFKEKNQLIIAYFVRATGDIQLNDELTDYKCLDRTMLESYDFSPLTITTNIINDYFNRYKHESS